MNVADETEYPHHNQVKRDDVIQQARHDQNKYAGEQRYQWGKAQVQVHGFFPGLADGAEIIRGPR
jgi:hypothetical protein